ncbi:unnamed protein product [Dimorphilus gyrociliatus]|uniref:Uncharacterized protein n=1 Tax=Dimorphilus gyrociliatus TaxID=2664684 RepID=A0A7I8VT14_9ANNE|nr:unnamed protein product [Dimorphilus gyrociliatus]
MSLLYLDDCLKECLKQDFCKSVTYRRLSNITICYQHSIICSYNFNSTTDKLFIKSFDIFNTFFSPFYERNIEIGGVFFLSSCFNDICLILAGKRNYYDAESICNSHGFDIWSPNKTLDRDLAKVVGDIYSTGVFWKKTLVNSIICLTIDIGLKTSSTRCETDKPYTVCWKKITGGWSQWSQWYRCSLDSCASNDKERFRLCNNPPPYQGFNCTGSSVEYLIEPHGGIASQDYLLHELANILTVVTILVLLMAGYYYTEWMKLKMVSIDDYEDYQKLFRSFDG